MTSIYLTYRYEKNAIQFAVACNDCRCGLQFSRLSIKARLQSRARPGTSTGKSWIVEPSPFNGIHVNLSLIKRANDDKTNKKGDGNSWRVGLGRPVYPRPTDDFESYPAGELIGRAAVLGTDNWVVMESDSGRLPSVGSLSVLDDNGFTGKGVKSSDPVAHRSSAS